MNIVGAIFLLFIALIMGLAMRKLLWDRKVEIDQMEEADPELIYEAMSGTDEEEAENIMCRLKELDRQQQEISDKHLASEKKDQ